MEESIKMDVYDRFQCIADQCPFTCCQGWEIAVDMDTFRKWQDIDGGTGNLLKHVKQGKTANPSHSKQRDNSGYSIRLNAHRQCPFIDKDGLCSIVLEHGDEKLSLTCRQYPRQVNHSRNCSEYSLSCSCPAVVDLLNRNKEKVHFIFSDAEQQRDKAQTEFLIRDTMLSIMQKDTFTIKDRILLIFYMLLSVRAEQNSEDSVLAERMETFHDAAFLQTITDIWRNVGLPQFDSFSELEELFLDIVRNYKKVESYKKYLQEITNYAESTDEGAELEGWIAFKEEYARYDYLFENILINNIFADCISRDIDEILLSFQMLVTEYIMTRYSVFLKYRVNGHRNAIEYKDIRDYVAVYARIIGYNQDGIREFWEESFDEAVWEFGYMLLLLG